VRPAMLAHAERRQSASGFTGVSIIGRLRWLRWGQCRKETKKRPAAQFRDVQVVDLLRGVGGFTRAEKRRIRLISFSTFQARGRPGFFVPARGKQPFRVPGVSENTQETARSGVGRGRLDGVSVRQRLDAAQPGA
jgi:hypothetical protein